MLHNEPLTWQAISQVLLGLVLVIAVIVVLLWLLRRVTALQQQRQAIKIVAATSLGSRERVMLVQIGSQQLLLGVTPSQITTLARYDQPIIESPADSDFATLLSKSRTAAPAGDV